MERKGIRIIMVFKDRKNSDFADYEKLIKQIMGVVAVRVVPDFSGDIAEIHVLTGTERNPKQVVRDIESALAASFAVAIDHKKISVAQIQNQREQFDQIAATEPSGFMTTYKTILRPRLASVGVLTKGRSMDVKVLLEIDQVLYEGSVSGVRTANNKLRLIASATLNALQNFLGNACSLDVDDISITKVGVDTVVVVVISVVTEGTVEKLAGTAFIHDDEVEAVAKATLSAVNRRLMIITQKLL